MIAFAPNNVPQYLIAQDRWLLWRIKQRFNKKTGEITATKPPISYHTSKRCDVTESAELDELRQGDDRADKVRRLGWCRLRVGPY